MELTLLVEALDVHGLCNALQLCKAPPDRKKTNSVIAVEQYVSSHVTGRVTQLRGVPLGNEGLSQESEDSDGVLMDM